MADQAQDESNSIGVYRIIAPSGSCYVGMTRDSFEGRWAGHRKELRAQKHRCAGLQRAFNKYGESELRFEVLEAVGVESSLESTLLKEQAWWDRLKAEGVKLYNGRPTGTGSVHHTDETRAKQSKAMEKLFRERHGLSDEDKVKSFRSGFKIEKKCVSCGSKFWACNAVYCSNTCVPGLVRNRGRAKSHLITEEEIVKLSQQGLKVHEIARELGVSAQTVSKLRLKFGLREKTRKSYTRGAYSKPV